MWKKIIKHLVEFSSAVLNGVDASGYPYSVRCKPEPDSDKRVLLINLPGNLPLQSGTASLLCHKHDELIGNQKSFVVRGKLERSADGWLFRPTAFIPGLGIGFMMGFPSLIINGRRNAKQYLQKRGLPRPQVNWQDVKQTWAEAKRERQS
jgi:hypothetical protein